MVAAVPNMENSFEYTSAQFDLVSHALTIGYAAQAAGFVYFGLTIPYVSQKHKMANIYGMLVMTSAFFSPLQSVEGVDRCVLIQQS